MSLPAAPHSHCSSRTRRGTAPGALHACVNTALGSMVCLVGCGSVHCVSLRGRPCGDVGAIPACPCGGVLSGEDGYGVVDVEFVAAVVAHDGVGAGVDAEGLMGLAEGVGAV